MPPPQTTSPSSFLPHQFRALSCLSSQLTSVCLSALAPACVQNWTGLPSFFLLLWCWQWGWGSSEPLHIFPSPGILFLQVFLLFHYLLGSWLCCNLSEVTLFQLGALPSPSSHSFLLAVTVILHFASLVLTPEIVGFVEGREIFLQLRNELLVKYYFGNFVRTSKS